MTFSDVNKQVCCVSLIIIIINLYSSSHGSLWRCLVTLEYYFTDSNRDCISWPSLTVVVWVYSTLVRLANRSEEMINQLHHHLTWRWTGARAPLLDVLTRTFIAWQTWLKSEINTIVKNDTVLCKSKNQQTSHACDYETSALGHARACTFSLWFFLWIFVK